MKRSLSLVVAVVTLLVLTVASALAGGWATVTLDDMPPEIHAGTSQQIHFRVWQHGQTPVHMLDANSPVEPLLIATNPQTGERLEVMATPDEEVGRFTVEVAFPSEGEWTWQILPNPLMLEGELPPLTVLPAIAAVPAAVEQTATESQPVSPALWVAVVALVLAAGAVALLAGRRAESAVPVAEK